MVSIERQWVEDRDSFLVDCFAEGKHDFDVLRECNERGYDLSEDGLAEKKRELRPRVLARVGTVINKRLDKIKRVNPATRIHEADELADMLWEGIEQAKDNNMWAVVAKLGTTLMQTHRLIGDEVNAVEHHEEVNPMVEIMRSTPPERRALLLETLHRHREELQAVLSPVLSFQASNAIADADDEDVQDAES